MNIPAEKQQTLRLRESPISQLLFRFSFPAIMAMPTAFLSATIRRRKPTVWRPLPYRFRSCWCFWHSDC